MSPHNQGHCHCTCYSSETRHSVCCCCLQALVLLTDHVADFDSIAPKGQQDHIWFVTTDLARAAAAAGAFLLDVLQMREAALKAESEAGRHHVTHAGV